MSTFRVSLGKHGEQWDTRYQLLSAHGSGTRKNRAQSV